MSQEFLIKRSSIFVEVEMLQVLKPCLFKQCEGFVDERYLFKNIFTSSMVYN